MTVSFSLGVVIGASLSSNFTSAMLGTQRAFKKLESGTGLLKRRQQELLEHTRRYGVSGTQSALRARNEYQRLRREITTLTHLQTKLTDVTNKGNMLREQRGALTGQLTGFVAKKAMTDFDAVTAFVCFSSLTLMKPVSQALKRRSLKWPSTAPGFAIQQEC